MAVREETEAAAAAGGMRQGAVELVPADVADADAPAGEGWVSTPVAGLGVDIVEIARMERVLERTPSFRERVFTVGERAYCDAYKKKAHLHYATHFAAKEAALKALGTGFSQGVGPKDVEVVHDERGRPCAVLHARAAELAAGQGVLELHLSLSRTHETAAASAIAVTAEVRPHPKEEAGPTPREELAAEFKKLRGMLDNLEEAVRGGVVGVEDMAGDAEGAGGAEDGQNVLDTAENASDREDTVGDGSEQSVEKDDEAQAGDMHGEQER